MNCNHSTNDNRELLIAALNKNQVAFAQIAKIAESVSSGTLKLRLNEAGKSVIMEYLNKKIHIDLGTLKIDGVKYLNDLAVANICVKEDLNQFHALISRIEEELTNKANKEHTHLLADITDYEELEKYDDTELRKLISTNKSSIEAFNKGFKTYKITNTDRTHLTDKPLVYIPIGFIKSNNTKYRGYIAHFIINLVATGDSEGSIFESAEVSIGHVMNDKLSYNPIMGISAIESKINGGNRKIGLGLFDVNGDNSIYEVDLILVNYNDYYRVFLNITCEVDTYIKLYTTAECSTELGQTSNTKSPVLIEDYARFQSYSLANNELDNKADKEHAHNINDIEGYEPYDDTDLRELIDEHTHTEFNDITLNGYTNLKLSVAKSSNKYIWSLRVFDDILESGQNLIMGLGKAQSKNNCAILYYHYDDVDPYLCLGLHTNDAMRLYKDKVEIDKPIKKRLIIQDDSGAATWTNYLQLLKPLMDDGNTIQFYLGKEISSRKCGYLGYLHSDTDPKITIGLHSADHLLTIGENTANIKPALSCEKTITASNITADNETRLKALESLPSIVDNIKIRQENHTSLYGTETFNTGTGIITNANITSGLTVNGTITSNNITYDNETRLRAVEQNKVSYSDIFRGPPIESLRGYRVNYKGSLNGNKCADIVIDTTLNIPVITFPKTIPRSTQIYSGGVLIASFDMYEVIGTKASWFKVIDKWTLHYIREDDNYDVSLVFKSTISGSGNYEDSYEIYKTTNYKCNATANEDKIPSIRFLLDLFYPVGSIYTSMNNTTPALLFGGEWERITDRFLYCAGSSGQTGGSKKITVANLPAHTHNFNDTYYLPDDIHGYPDGWKDTSTDGDYYWRWGKKEYTDNDTTESTGSGEDYMPPYMTVFAWHRTK